jgi:replication factor C small subunit
MEMYASNTRFILGANYSSKIIEPIQSRCSVFRFLPLSDEEINQMIERIAKAEGLEVDKEASYALRYVSEGDLRRLINCLQGVAMHSKKITQELVFKYSSKARPKEIIEMMNLAIGGKFANARELLHKLIIEYGLSGEDILVQMFKEIDNLKIDEKLKIEIIEKIGEYNFRLVEGANQTIQLEACLAQFYKLSFHSKK